MGYLYSALEVDGNQAQILCLPRVDLGMSRLFLEHLASSDPQAEHVVIEDQAGFHLNPELHPMPARIHVLPLPPYSPELNPVEAIGGPSLATGSAILCGKRWRRWRKQSERNSDRSGKTRNGWVDAGFTPGGSSNK